MAATPRSDADTLKVLEDARQRFERLRAAAHRNEAEIELCQRNHAEAAEACREICGTDDEAEIRRAIEDDRNRNAERVDAFLAEIVDHETRLAALDAQPA